MHIGSGPREPQAICAAVLADRYLAPGERTREAVFKRVARALARAEQPCARSHFARLFHRTPCLLFWARHSTRAQ
ncbi:MAG: hypothetical protein ACTHJZ_21355 [Trinickia sp.]|uniref:hypothetical protein n=1 Tax=Trinickia sp. TaxID=2571163 RepID=UPI003F7EFA80